MSTAEPYIADLHKGKGRPSENDEMFSATDHFKCVEEESLFFFFFLIERLILNEVH